MLDRSHRLEPGRLERFALRDAPGLAVLTLAGTGFALLAGLVAGRWEPLYAADRAVTDDLNHLVAGDTLVLDVLGTLTDFGGGTVLTCVLALATAFLLVRREVRPAAYVVATSLGALILYPVLKLLIGRLRPVVAEPVATATGMSFPSGHSMSSLVSYGVLLLVFAPLAPRRARALAVAAVAALVVLVGFTRVALGVHHLSDVIGGWLLGLVWLWVTAAAFRPWRPEAVPGAQPGAGPVSCPEPQMPPQRSEGPLSHPWRVAAEALTAWVLVLGALFGTGLLLTKASGSTALAVADRTVIRWVAGLRTPVLDAVAAFGGRIVGVPWILAGTLAACALALAVLRRPRPAVFLLVVTVGQLALFLTASAAVGRSHPATPVKLPGDLTIVPPTSPPVAPPGDPAADLAIAVHESWPPLASGFPSSQVAGVVALFTAIMVLVRRATTRRGWRLAAGAAAVLVPLLCALSQIYRGTQHPVGVLASALLALPWVTVAWWVLLRDRPHRPLDTARPAPLDSRRQ
ncbi:phosphatase PAP2 family protein [Microbispora cellulosiformans]|uniref:Phosphatase PAP2 family protein n=1 Tax=Microbispora cellulosiformans TaxID=2614688 RepID=A0A5J5K006_9ACTN|nr:phosphatase PAP2 family protein [Microbispora cellulosiformans]KAA9377563.1 phosphatase PAP2 family protein [Microbispora cellulosiformans]